MNTDKKKKVPAGVRAYLAGIGAKGGSVTGPTKVRSSAEMARRVRVRWDKARAKAVATQAP